LSDLTGSLFWPEKLKATKPKQRMFSNELLVSHDGDIAPVATWEAGWSYAMCVHMNLDASDEVTVSSTLFHSKRFQRQVLCRPRHFVSDSFQTKYYHNSHLVAFSRLHGVRLWPTWPMVSRLLSWAQSNTQLPLLMSLVSAFKLRTELVRACTGLAL
jgi:hypothetical protein